MSFCTNIDNTYDGILYLVIHGLLVFYMADNKGEHFLSFWHTLCSFVLAAYFMCSVNTGEPLILIKCTKFNIMINPCTTEPRCCQNNVIFILVTIAWLLLFKEPPPAPIVSDLNYALFSSNSSNILVMILC